MSASWSLGSHRLAGQPALAVLRGLSSQDLPVGVQLEGDSDDELLLALPMNSLEPNRGTPSRRTSGARRVQRPAPHLSGQ